MRVAQVETVRPLTVDLQRGGLPLNVLTEVREVSLAVRDLRLQHRLPSQVAGLDQLPDLGTKRDQGAALLGRIRVLLDAGEVGIDRGGADPELVHEGTSVGDPVPSPASGGRGGRGGPSVAVRASGWSEVLHQAVTRSRPPSMVSGTGAS
jgi:hypothetical protein